MEAVKKCLPKLNKRKRIENDPEMQINTSKFHGHIYILSSLEDALLIKRIVHAKPITTWDEVS